MQEIRCSKCDKLLGKVFGEYEIKCPRCKTVNEFRFGLSPIVKIMEIQSKLNTNKESVENELDRNVL